MTTTDLERAVTGMAGAVAEARRELARISALVAQLAV